MQAGQNLYLTTDSTDAVPSAPILSVVERVEGERLWQEENVRNFAPEARAKRRLPYE